MNSQLFMIERKFCITDDRFAGSLKIYMCLCYELPSIIMTIIMTIMIFLGNIFEILLFQDFGIITIYQLLLIYGHPF